jgi:hemolysin III
VSKKLNEIKLSLGEEIGNSITHGIMAMGMLFLLPLVAVLGHERAGWRLSVSLSVFIISLLLMFLSSSLYHAMPPESQHKKVLRILDHIFIYVAIAGSYTPVALVLIRGWQGTLILVVQWVMVLFGILYKSLLRQSIPKASVIIYLSMGWVAVLFVPTLLRVANPYFLVFIVLGGLLYSVGAWFYRQKHRPYFHFIWHLFVNFASLSHLVAMLVFL